MKAQTLANNQIVMHESGKSIFQSYNSIIAINEMGKITLDEKYWNYSKTTAKYRNQFLNETTKETEQKLKDGIYKLAGLN